MKCPCLLQRLRRHERRGPYQAGGEVQERSAGSLQPAAHLPLGHQVSWLCFGKAALPLPLFSFGRGNMLHGILYHSRFYCSDVCTWEVGRIPPASGHWPLNSLTSKPENFMFL